jgi:ATP-dependent RNA helicase DeaD
VGQVINYELPESAEWLTHRVGRTGRMGRAGRAITFLTPDNGATWRQFEKKLGKKFRRQKWAADHPGEPGNDNVRQARSAMARPSRASHPKRSANASAASRSAASAPSSFMATSHRFRS